MGSEQNKTLPSDKKEKAKKKPRKDRKSIGWIIGVVVLILIAITFILPTTIFSGSSAADVVFGRYNEKDIALNDVYFQTALNSALSRAQGSGDSLTQNYTAFNDAFMMTAFNLATTEMAEAAGYTVTDGEIDSAIVSSGYYNDANGNPDINRYNSTSDYEKNLLRDTVRTELPMQTVIDDFTTVNASSDEVSFVTMLASTTRSFEYAYINSSLYPDEDTIRYAEENSDRFRTMDLSVITFPTESEAQTVLDQIGSGTLTFEDASANSIDSYQANGGVIGRSMLYSVEGFLSDANDAVRIFEAEEGALVGPIRTYLGYSIFRADTAPAAADTTDRSALNEIKTYIQNHETEVMNTFLDETAAAFEDRLSAGEDFYDIAYDMGVQIVDVPETNANPYNFPSLSTFAQTDPVGGLSSALNSDSDYYTALFSAEEGMVLPVQNADGARVITKVGAMNEGRVSTTHIETMYPFLVDQMSLMDLQNAVFSSPNFENNFMEVFLSRMLRTTTV